MKESLEAATCLLVFCVELLRTCYACYRTVAVYYCSINNPDPHPFIACFHPYIDTVELGLITKMATENNPLDFAIESMPIIKFIGVFPFMGSM